MSTTYELSVCADVKIVIKGDEGDIFTRAEDVEGFQKHLYGKSVSDKESVLKHWAYNCVANGVNTPSRLDGWADLDRDKVWIEVTDVQDGLW